MKAMEDARRKQCASFWEETPKQRKTSRMKVKAEAEAAHLLPLQRSLQQRLTRGQVLLSLRRQRQLLRQRLLRRPQGRLYVARARGLGLGLGLRLGLGLGSGLGLGCT